MRGVDVVARYDNIKCTVLTDKVALATLTTLANGNVNQIREICKHSKCFITDTVTEQIHSVGLR